MKKQSGKDNGMYDGSRLSNTEQFQIKTITCETTAEQVFSDYANYMREAFNYEMKFVRCPADCASRNNKITGLGTKIKKITNKRDPSLAIVRVCFRDR